MGDALKTKRARPTIFDYPILAREWRSRFRSDQTFAIFAIFSVLAVWGLIRRLSDDTSTAWGHTVGVRALASLSQDLLENLVWIQLLAICLMAPLNSAPLIAREREKGATDDLLLTPLSPLRLTMEKWGAGGVFIALMLLALWPLDFIALLMGNSPPGDLWGIGLLALGCLAWGDALGLAFSAHARRAAGALRGALGVTLVWLGGSFICGVLAGEASFIRGGGIGAPFYVVWLGRTNPILCAFDILHPSAFMVPKWPYCAAFLGGGTILLLWRASLGLRKPLPEMPFIAASRGKRGGVSGVLSRLEVPLVGRFSPRNPVLGREARGKFRLRQPPVPILVVEIALALGVVATYLWLARLAFNDIYARPIVFWGVVWTSAFISLLAASAQGASALVRERENGTWESLRLSLLSGTEIVGGKLIASLVTILLLSLPAWPLLLFCVEWTGSWEAIPSNRLVQPFQLVAAVLIWLGVLWLQTTLGFLVSTRASKAGGAIVMTVGVSLIWMLGSLFFFVINTTDDSAMGFLSVTNPVIALANATDPRYSSLWTSTGWPFALFAFALGLLMLALANAEVVFQLQGSRTED